MSLGEIEMNTSMFNRYNRNKIDDRHIDTLIGLSKGIIADGKVNQLEAEFLHNWLIQNSQTTDNPLIINLLEKVDVMLNDGILDNEEVAELHSVLKNISGNSSEFGELAKTTNLPINEPMPPVTFEDRSFLFTGTCAFGTKKQCQDATESLGGLIAKTVNKSLNYLVLGTYVSDSWAHEVFGRKIEKAMEYRDKKGVPLLIITEEHWANSGNLAI